ncbi:hypothetical protein [Thalassospira alkalitolerans]|uniref:hypothetical protein n=1 Tax=Thalassospira alkalitolerans TaxID=1293890 RepID=UPI0030EF38E8|tara:strand:+ start:7811 stop:8035 length:225 start_codon:yes stop_codon:yes gene_type:complete
MFAYCYEAGDIQFGDQVPIHATKLASGPEAILRRRIGSTRRVPGIPAEDAHGDRQAIEQYRRFLTAPRRRVRGA